MMDIARYGIIELSRLEGECMATYRFWSASLS